MAEVFNAKFFNPEVFGRYVNTVPRVKQNVFLKAGVLRPRNELRRMLPDQAGGSFIVLPMTGRIGGAPVNYDGSTNITATGIGTFSQGIIVVGRGKAWEELDFSADITGHDFMADIAQQVGEYWDDIDQTTILKTLEGIFGVTADGFSTKHTLDITADAIPTVGVTTLNNAIQKAAGANKGLFTMAVMHSTVATNLENLQLLEYLKYTDKDGVQRNTNMATWNGRTVLVDDDAPALSGYYAATSTTAGALKVVASSATTGQVNLSDVTGSDFSPAGVAANDYVVPGMKYVTYLLGQGAFDYCDVGAKVPYEMFRDPSTNGGKDILFTRQRKVFAPNGFSFVQPSTFIKSPTDTHLATAARWTVVTDDAGTGYYPSKAIPFARIISQG